MFSDYLDTLMKARGVPSQNALASYAQVTSSAVSRWLNGVSVPDPKQCRALASHLRVTQIEMLRAAGHITDETAEPEGDAEFRHLLRLYRPLGSPERALVLEVCRTAGRLVTAVLDADAKNRENPGSTVGPVGHEQEAPDGSVGTPESGEGTRDGEAGGRFRQAGRKRRAKADLRGPAGAR